MTFYDLIGDIGNELYAFIRENENLPHLDEDAWYTDGSTLCRVYINTDADCGFQIVLDSFSATEIIKMEAFDEDKFFEGLNSSSDCDLCDWCDMNISEFYKYVISLFKEGRENTRYNLTKDEMIAWAREIKEG